jgi:peptide/nickel transport system permease protein/nickel transport system permease protein
MIEQVRVELGLDKPMITRYLKWLGGFFTGDFGMSVYSFRPISEDLADYFPTTFALVGLSLAWIIVVSIPISLLCARYKNGVFDHLTRGVTLLGICLPTFWLGFLLLLEFAVKLPLFTYFPLRYQGLLLPSFTLAVP